MVFFRKEEGREEMRSKYEATVYITGEIKKTYYFDIMETLPNGTVVLKVNRDICKTAEVARWNMANIKGFECYPEYSEDGGTGWRYFDKGEMPNVAGPIYLSLARKEAVKKWGYKGGDYGVAYCTNSGKLIDLMTMYDSEEWGRKNYSVDDLHLYAWMPLPQPVWECSE